ncbi:hypothetical protein Gotri_028026 [Gossypium trilobum]|uniref:RING-CH-type domain-containing protein n=1 Tax=Gossypium trilobum TaxID=34281 RepID=A0A7J9FSD8_9ROSI|nr:hypothetical protein [Gossypium trilobum]
MDQEKRGDCIGASVNLSQVGECVGGNSKNPVNGVVSGTAIVENSEEKLCSSGENSDLRLQNDGFESCKNQEMDFGRGIGQNDLGTNGNSSSLIDANVVVSSSEGLVEERNESICEEMNEIRGVAETLGQVDQGSSESFPNSVTGSVIQTIIVINTQEAASLEGISGEFEVKDYGLGSSKVSVEGPKTKAAEAEDACVIDVKGSGGGQRQFKESWDEETVCRFCHLNSEQSLESTDSTLATAADVDLIQLGCECKDELGIAHSHCAEAWFKLKGNRMCEICGQTAKNISGVRDNRFIEDWHGQGSTSGGASFSDQHSGCWRGQPFCNFLMACLVMAFVLPWFFRVNMF